MVSFIKSVLLDLKERNLRLQDFYFILPSKRAGTFLKHELSSIIKEPIFAPHIFSIEEFVEELSGLRSITNAELLFKLYETYQDLTPDSETEPFEAFSKWAQILLQDFNEIDRYLIEHESIFDYLSAIKEIDHWSLESHQTSLIKSHLKFWTRLKNYYKQFSEKLLKQRQGYQGLIYREATNHLEHYIEGNLDRKHIFMGFNALNASESIIIQGLLQNDLANIYWDIDKTFIEDPLHDAGLFTRSHKQNWKYFKKQSFNWISHNYSSTKNINVVGIPKLIGQAKYIGKLLGNLQTTNSNLSNVAVVLGEENLLIPVLNSIPKSISKLNVTMGLPLKYVPLASLFELLFSLHRNNTKNYYYKDVISILTHPSIYQLFDAEHKDVSTKIVSYLQKNNIVHVTTKQLNDFSIDAAKDVIDVLFQPWDNNPKTALENCAKLIIKLKISLQEQKQTNHLELEYLYRFHTLFNQLSELHSGFEHIKSIKALFGVYNELLSSETLDFKGEPLEGLQIMGMLESRALDFETVIISSVNEGILPSGKTNNSFIPFNIKIENGLPTFKEKDAVYTYHFYRLLQRAKNIYILYNTEVDALKGGEKSRFITQLEIEGIHQIKHSIASPLMPVVDNSLKQINKSSSVMEAIKSLANEGFSPSSLTNYIRNPIDFYYEKVLGIKEFEDVEENIAANTLGSVIHNTLEDFYKPLEGDYLTVEVLNELKKNVENTVIKHFRDLYKDGDITTGKNLIIFEIAQRYILNFIDTEIESILSGNQIKIIAIEGDEIITIPLDDSGTTVKLKGKVDRVDQYNNVVRVIDYKSGRVEQNKVEIINWNDITTDYNKYSKSFQILCYAYMMYRQQKIQLPIEAGIISFKNLGEGFLKFAKKDKAGAYAKKETLITEDTLSHFENELKKLILEICNPKIDFVEKEIENDY